MSSRRRPYLNLKESITDLFRTTARWLHDTLEKESQYEKPYLDEDYRAMHLNMPTPTWPRTPDAGQVPSKDRTWTFIWDPGICTIMPASPNCGEEFNISVSIGLLPPGSQLKTIEWAAQSSNAICVEILSITNGISGRIHCKAGDECNEGVVSICVKGTLIGSIREELMVANPFRDIGSLDYRVATGLPALSSSFKESGYTYDCGCIDIPLDCCGVGTITWDDALSGETVARNSYVLVAIEDSGSSGPYTWSISGTGFWLDEAFSKTTEATAGLTNIIYTDETACGACTITVINCDGSSQVVGYVRATTGLWCIISDIDFCSSYAGSACNNTETEGKYQYYDVFLNGTVDPPGCAGVCHNTPCYPLCLSERISEWKCLC